MRKFLAVFAMMLGLAGFVQANCGNGNDNGNGNGCNGEQGPQGPVGSSGQNGANGADGKTGGSGQNANARVMPVLDAALRVYDGKYIQLQAFNVVKFADRNQRAFGNSSEFMAGARVVFKLGKSYEEREIERLRREMRGVLP